MKFICLICLSVLSLSCWGQTIDYNKIIIPEKTPAVSFEEKLVQIAWKNNPSNKVVQQNASVLKKEQKLASLDWLNDVMAVGNLNEYTIHGLDYNTRAIYYPRYNLSLRLSLGTFFLTPLKTSIARDKSVAGFELVNEQKISIRKETLLGVELLKEQFKVLKFRSRMKEDFLSLYKSSEQKFAAGQVPLEEYRMAAREYVSNAELEVMAQSSFNQRKIELEALIGLRLEEVSGYDEFLAQLESQIKFE
ncbi:MAG: TolC family protein [Bacteroidota bacterium]